jgi:hypothetical protein
VNECDLKSEMNVMKKVNDCDEEVNECDQKVNKCGKIKVNEYDEKSY